MNIIHDGDCSRVEKIKNIISLDKKIVFDHLRVCHHKRRKKGTSYNCSTCQKCRRTVIPIGLLDINYLDQLKTFNIDKTSFLNYKEEYFSWELGENSAGWQSEMKNEVKKLDEENNNG